MRILILGVGDAFSRVHFGAGALIESLAGELVMIDCGDLIHRKLHHAGMIAKWNIDASMIHDIILTHLHGDHCNGLESLGFYRRILGMKDPATPRPRLHTTQPVADRLWQRLASAMDCPMGGDRPSTLADYFDLRIIAPQRETTIAGLRVDCRFTRHPIPTIGLRIADGRHTLAWSGDTPFEQAHIDWLEKGAEVIIHESNLGSAHTPIASLNALPEAIRRRMKLIHLCDDFDPAATSIEILTEGQVLAL